MNGHSEGQHGDVDAAGTDVARVHYLPAPTGNSAPEAASELVVGPVSEPIEGELVTDEEYRARQKALAIERYRGYRRDIEVAARFTRTALTHERTKTAGRAVVRNVLYVPAGAGVIAKRVWEAKTNSRYERLMRAAEIAGDHEKLTEWENRSEQAKQARHARRMDWLDAPGKLAKALAVCVASFVGLLLGLGILFALVDKDIGRVLDPVTGFLDAMRWAVWAVAIAWGPFVLVAPWVAALYLWNLGRRHGATPVWVAPAAVREDRDGEPITPSVVVTALRDLGISSLRKAIQKMEDGGAGMLGAITLAGCGVEVDVTLPSGVSTHEVQTRRRKLAENLGRHEHELFITIPAAARTVRLWIAEPGALDEPIGPSALVTDPDATVDVFTGKAPWGQDLHGDRVALPLLMRHLLITGLSNQGKTAALRALVLWLVLDPTVELRIADLKGVGDWRMFQPIATTLIQGPTDDHVIAATHMLEAGVDEMQRRIGALEQSGATDGVTHQMSRSGQGFHPLFLIVDEAQVAFMCPAKDATKTPYGGTKATSRYFMAARKLHNQGRAVSVHLWQGTQDPTNENLPKLVREGAHIRAALVLGTEEQARMAVGDKAVNGGAAPHKLRYGLDKGTLVVSGDGVPLPPGQTSLTVRTNYVDGAAATEIVDRALERRHAARQAAADQNRDLLADVGAALHGQDVKASDVAARLREIAPDYPPYADLTAQTLADQLGRLGVAVRMKDGFLTVRNDRVVAALALRPEEVQ